MKIKFPSADQYISTVAVLALSLAFSGTAFAHGAGAGKAINVNANGDSGSATALLTNDNHCRGSTRRPNFSEKGCVRAGEGESVEITYRIVGPDLNCVTGEPWVLDSIQLANVNGAKPTTDAEWLATLPANVLRDFRVDPLTNEASTGPGAAPNTLVLVNRNISEMPYYVWYRLRATCVSTDKQIFLDPRYDNEGTR